MIVDLQTIMLTSMTDDASNDQMLCCKTKRGQEAW